MLFAMVMRQFFPKYIQQTMSWQFVNIPCPHNVFGFCEYIFHIRINVDLCKDTLLIASNLLVTRTL